MTNRNKMKFGSMVHAIIPTSFEEDQYPEKKSFLSLNF